MHAAHHTAHATNAHHADRDEVCLATTGLTVAYRHAAVLEDISLELPTGRLIGMVGPNGAGKSTLLKTMLGLIRPLAGEVRIFGEPLSRVRRRVAYVPQRETVDWDFPVSVLDVVTMGLYDRIGWCLPVRKRHRDAAREALARVGIGDLAERQISQLSGGQQQRTFLARALVQDADLYLMDEPFAAVDAATEQAIVSLLRDLRARGKSAVVVHHDLPTVPEYFDHVVLLNKRIIAAGPTGTTWTERNLQAAYGGRLAIGGSLK